MKKYIYYGNGGSGNHGCEAIIRSLENILRPREKSISLSIAVEQDNKYGVAQIVDSKSLFNVNTSNISFLWSYCQLKFKNKQYALDLFPYKRILQELDGKREYLALSVGGDNYCYDGTDFYIELDNLFHRKKIKTAMVGCSIESEAISDPEIFKDLSNHKLIIARESITFDALRNRGLNNIVLLPDPAFLLKTSDKELPDKFKEGDTIGINLSPHVDKCSKDGRIVSRNVDILIQHIIANTNSQIALIPHVVWPQSNDMDTLVPLYEKYKDTGRIVLIEDCNAEELKGYIARCRFLVAARTHASIAAYSNCVPTLVIGYSVKAKGIAKDIFGTYENYVVPSQSLTSDTDLIKAFEWLRENETSIRSHLHSFMPDYCKKAYRIKDELDRIS